MDGVEANPAEIRRFQRNLNTFNRELRALTSKLQSQLRSLGTTWRDDEYRKFEQNMAQATKAFDRYLAQADEYSRYLDKKAEPLERYKGR